MKGFDFMQEAIDDCITSEKSCYQCKTKTLCQNEYGSHLIIDTSAISDPGYPNSTRIVGQKLNSIAKTIKVGGKTYILVGIINFKMQQKHYSTYLQPDG